MDGWMDGLSNKDFIIQDPNFLGVRPVATALGLQASLSLKSETINAQIYTVIFVH